MLRTICFHVKREWYRKSTKPWMSIFPRLHKVAARDLRTAPPQAPAPNGHAAQHQAELLRACHAEGMDMSDIFDDFSDVDVFDEANIEDPTDDLQFVYGFVKISDGQKIAWRKLVDSSGAEVMPQELASHTTNPEGNVGLMVAHFLDGTAHAIPGMLCKRKGGPAKAGDAAKVAKVEKAAVAAERTEEENPEEESDFEPDECVEAGEESPESESDFEEDQVSDLPEIDFLNKYVRTCGLKKLASLNDKIFLVQEKRDDGRLRIRGILKATPLEVYAKPDNVELVDNKTICRYLSEIVSIRGTNFAVKAQTQGDRPCIVTLKPAELHGRQMGMLSCRSTGDDIVKAFTVVVDITNMIKLESYSPEWPGFTKADFLEKRQALLEMS
jgi:hypothetical protein